MNQSAHGSSSEAARGVQVRIHAAGVLGPGVDLMPSAGVQLLARVEGGSNPRVWIEEWRAGGSGDDEEHRSQIGNTSTGTTKTSITTTGTIREIDRRGCVLMPALINAHAHLDLTHMGPCPADPFEPGSPASSFAAFGAHVLGNRLDDAQAIRKTVCDGARRSLAGGVAAIGDIAGVWRTEPLEALRKAGLRGVSYLEVFGHGDRVDASAARMRQIVEIAADTTAGLDGDGCRLGLSPHASYSASRRLYEACAALAAERDLLVMTHLAECPEEREFVASGRGAIRTLLERLGGIDAATEDEYRHGGTPIAHVERTLSDRWSVVHINDCDDPGMASLRERGVAVVYCPRASAYFAHERHFGPHRYREMLDLGIPVALGTDSIICLPPDEADHLSPLDDARFLYRRDGAEPQLLMEMLYTHGARVLRLDEKSVRMPGIGEPGHELLGLVAVDVQSVPGASAGERVMMAKNPPERITAEKL